MKQTDDHVSFFDPKKADSYKHEDVAHMANLSSQQIEDLAKAYPNKESTTYLVLKDTSKDDRAQLYPLSSWENLNNLRKIGQKQFVAHSFASTHKAGTQVASPQNLQTGKLQDLSKDEVLGAEGIKGQAANDNTSQDFPNLDKDAADHASKAGKPKKASKAKAK